jgi:hypothetical protein
MAARTKLSTECILPLCFLSILLSFYRSLLALGESLGCLLLGESLGVLLLGDLLGEFVARQAVCGGVALYVACRVDHWWEYITAEKVAWQVSCLARESL